MNTAAHVRITKPQDARTEKKLDRVMELPDVPHYSGKSQFLDGEELTGDGNVSYQMRFLTNEKPEDVAAWYANALPMYNWKTLDQSRSNLTARNKRGALVTINAQRSGKKDLPTMVNLCYTQPQK